MAVKSSSALLPHECLETIIRASAQKLLELKMGANGPAEGALSPFLTPLLATMACHAAVPSNRMLDESQTSQLLKKLEKLEEGWTCPHGRPILFRLSFHSVEKHFERC